MRCKKHLQDLTSTVGVCASCLRHRLQPLFEAQAQQARVYPRASAVDVVVAAVAASDDIGKHGNVTRRKTDRRNDRSFYSTPQGGPIFSGEGKTPPPSSSSKKKKLGKLWILSNIFNSRSNKSEISSRESCDPSSSSAVAAPSPSWFSTILPGRRKNRRRECEQSDHGNPREENVSGGCIGEKSPCRREKTAAIEKRWRLGLSGKRVSGMVICLSPLVGGNQKRKCAQN
ncbi:hypothetical protein TanjilG_25284 [Lupinus angustifolius]|uniref:Uncharacterized protein n=1 Tax=Lupinus angustifolius TaxID=3871 RepID=A0A4P1RVZ6_LUPAN|nr:PREDICTED: uncharacterized protein LOC109359492 [Lupinus angustifolius]OIW18841.1 hypothetical protein TanjilG_25284 [Lupinus angustifolius]